MGNESAVIYFSIIVLLVYLAKRASLVTIKKRQTNNNETFFTAPTFLLISIFTIFCAIRYNVGTDYPRYLSAYETGRAFTDRFEPLFRGISYILYKLKAHVVFYFGTWSLLQIVLYLYAFKDKKELYPYLVFFLFTNSLFFSWMNGIRQDLSSCIVLMGLSYILKEKTACYIITCIIASLFHISAILLIVLYPLLNRKIWFSSSISIPIILIIIALAINFSLGSNILQLESIVSAYSSLFDRDVVDFSMILEGIEEKKNMGLGMIARLIFYISIILHHRQIKYYFNSQYFDKIVYPLFIAGVFFKYAIPAGAVIIARPFRFFSFFTTIALAYYVYYLFNSKYSVNKMYGIVIVIISLVLLLAPMLNVEQDYSYTLYQTIFGNL